MLNLKDVEKSMEIPDTIWSNIISAWCYYKYKTQTEICEDNESLLNQQLWFNSHICVKHKLYNNLELRQKGINKIKDIVNMNAKRLYTWGELVEHYGKLNDFLGYHSLVTAIPSKWKRIINTQNLIENVNTEEKMEKIFELECPTSYIYRYLMQRIEKDDEGELIWTTALKINLEEDQWEKICLYSFQLSPLTKLRYFQYRLLCSKLVTNHHRSRWDKTMTPNCIFCKDELCTTMHLLMECRIVKKLWKAIEIWLSRLLLIRIKITKIDIILNYYQGKYKETINTIMLIVKHYIYASCCQRENISFIGATYRVQEYRKIEKTTLFKLKKYNKYYDKWGKIDY